MPLALPAVDCHAHVFDPQRFPLADTGGHMPAPAECGTPAQFAAVLDAHGVSHGLLVNAQAGYGLDNRCMLDAIARSNGRFKGVALIGHGITDAELEALRAGGVAGARFNLLFAHATSIRGDAGIRLLSRLQEIGWFAQIYYRDDAIVDVLPALEATGIRVVIDHCGGFDPARGLGQAGFRALLDLGRGGRAAIKLSGAFRISRQPWPHTDMDAYIAAILEAFGPDRCVWGSDWPFVRFPARVDYGPQLALLERWIPDAAAQRRVLWDNPRDWFGFAPRADD
ncbi:MAG: amidohydrolase family protein [Burkholderiales bacterium]|nr:amidohydrolase family protein [Burkholderiales bacterium]